MAFYHAAEALKVTCCLLARGQASTCKIEGTSDCFHYFCSPLRLDLALHITPLPYIWRLLCAIAMLLAASAPSTATFAMTAGHCKR